MQHIGWLVRRTALVGAVLVAGATPEPAEAQLARRAPTERILVLAPVPASDADTAYAVEFANALRDRMTFKYRFRIGVISSENICEALEASGFNCRVPLAPDNAPALARFMQASGYVVGWMHRTNDSIVVRLRMVDNAGSGLAGWERIATAKGTTAANFGNQVSDALDDRVKAAELARECSERRSRGDPKGAAERAERVFQMYPDHPSAAQCLAFVYEVQRQPVDSLVSALRRAVKGDSLNGRAWEELGRRLQGQGDTAGALRAFRNQLRAEPGNGPLRLGVAAGFVTQKDYDQAVEVLDEGLVMNPGDLPMLALKERACLEGSLWRCALETLAQEYQIDTTLARDSIFYQKVFGAAQSVPDTAAMLEWSARGVQAFPNSGALWRARAAALKAADQRTGALEAYDRILALDSSQVSSALAAAQYLLDSSLVIDTGVPLDTARLFKAERLLELVGRQTSDTVTSMNLAALFYNPAAKIAQLRIRPGLPIASRFLERAIQYDLRGSLRVPANFFLGLALFFQVTELDQQVRQSKSCELVDVEAAMAQKAKTALTVGRSISPQVANQLLPYVDQIEAAIKTYKPAFRCPGA